MTRRQAVLLFAAVWLGYLLIGVYLAVIVEFHFGDALSRVQSAQSVLFSRTPHLSAIGFVFSPLTTIVQLPLTALSVWWPALTTSGLSAVIMSSGFMAGSVVQISGISRDRGLGRGVTTLITLCYTINPMIVLYAANGMSEAPYLFFLAWAIRRLIRWVDTDDVHELIVAGIALALAYLTRYDGGAATLAAAAVVGTVTFRRSERERRWSRTALDMVLVAAPGALAFVVWAIAGWLITGDAFAQFTSEYGNAAIVAATGAATASGAAAMVFSFTELLILAPLLPVLLVTVIVIRTMRRRLLPLLPPLLLIGAVLAFQIIGYARGSTFGFLRFSLTVVVLSATIALLAVPARRSPPVRRPGPRAALPPVRPHPSTRRRYAVSAVIAVVVLAVGLPVTAVGMTSKRFAPQEYAIRSIVDPQPDSVDPRRLDEQRVIRSFSTERAIAQFLDRLDLPDGSVLCDTVFGFAVVVQSTRPRQFVIPSDADFTRVINEPAAHGVQYLLTVPPSGRGETDALNRRYPTVYNDGARIGVLALEAPNDGADLPDWRIYRTLPATTSATGSP
ncbi:glycosyltransferase family 39 protein [Millisia brevis]|uniref:glycosyltransferase family 39 protein n=1 Tax=Millisia brevis TaxID=264148 RepID=UPI00083054F8|nr:glycosyltransferase family 39 protein [Millisia brevis]